MRSNTGPEKSWPWLKEIQAALTGDKLQHQVDVRACRHDMAQVHHIGVPQPPHDGNLLLYLRRQVRPLHHFFVENLRRGEDKSSGRSLSG